MPEEHRKAGGGKLRPRGDLRRPAMFRLASSRSLKTGTDDQGFWVGFSGKVSQVADVHQHGSRDRPSLCAKAVSCPKRERLGATDDGERLLDILYKQLAG